MTTVRVSTKNSDREMMSLQDAAEHVVDAIARGGLALVPFGVAYAFLTGSLAPLKRIYELKLRPPKKACPILVAWDEFVEVADATTEETAGIKKVVDADLPVGVLVGPRLDSDVYRSIPPDCVDLLTTDGKLGLFMNMGGMSEDILAIARKKRIRLFGSSANLSGMGNSFSLADVPESIIHAMEIVCEAGTCRYANPDRLPSSVVDLETGTLTRRGILHEEIERLLAG
jgi:tRNA A37 threonylcarbamoyladenosine synthetase subunit TsaC/SUA5/YrdC